MNAIATLGVAEDIAAINHHHRPPSENALRRGCERREPGRPNRFQSQRSLVVCVHSAAHGGTRLASRFMTPTGRLRRFAVAGSAALVAAFEFTIAASAAESPIVTESFTHTSTSSSNWSLPSAPTGTNVACLTASPNSSQTPIPGCALTPPDSDGSGALRLTDAGNGDVGEVQIPPPTCPVGTIGVMATTWRVVSETFSSWP
jgi:hypothetical protein